MMVWITPTDSSVVSNSIILVVSSSIKGSWTSRLDSVEDTVPPLRLMYLLYSSG